MKKIIALFVFCFVFVSFAATQATTDDYLNKGLQAYKEGDWESAILLLKNAVSLPETSSPEVLYVLVMSEMFNGNYLDVLKDGKTFCNLYPTSEYKVYVVDTIEEVTVDTTNVDTELEFGEALNDIAVVEKEPKVEGRSMTMFLAEKR